MTRGGSQLVRSRPYPDETGLGRVLPFRRPGTASDPVPAGTLADSGSELSDDLARYEQEPDEVIDYRHRMLMNVIALAIVTLLVGAGVWIADTLAAMQRDQDCVMQGRSNCAPIEIPLPKRD